jgi:hypothetical protein
MAQRDLAFPANVRGGILSQPQGLKSRNLVFRASAPFAGENRTSGPEN